MANLVAENNGGLYRSTDALSASPTFTNTLSFPGTSISEPTAEFATHTLAFATTFDAATGFGGGRVYRSTDGGATWVLRVDNDFCTPLCFFSIAIAVDPRPT